MFRIGNCKHGAIFRLIRYFVRSDCDTDFHNGHLRCHSLLVEAQRCEMTVFSGDSPGEEPQLKRGAAADTETRNTFIFLLQIVRTKED